MIAIDLFHFIKKWLKSESTKGCMIGILVVVDYDCSLFMFVSLIHNSLATINGRFQLEQNRLAGLLPNV
jgi:hypothetical protein